MNKGISILLVNLTLVIAATAAPNQSQSQSIKQNIATFVGTPFSSGGNLCPLPPTLTFLNKQGDHKGWSANGGQFNPDFCLADLQNFLTTQNIDPTLLQDLKSWISQLPIDPSKITELENWLQTLGTYCNDTVGVEIDDTSSKSTGTSLSGVDQPVTAVPEPSTISTFILGIGLLGGVLLRLRPAR